MSEIVNFVRHGALYITPRIINNILHQLPMLKAEFTQIHTKKFPHLVDQLEFLADAIEDFAENVYKDLPYFAIAEAAFALLYVHRVVHIIPNFLSSPLAYADDSGVVRAVLIEHEKAFEKYAHDQGFSWAKITNKA